VFPPHVCVGPDGHGLLFVASGAPIDPLAGAAPTLREAPDELALFGIATLEEFASRWLLGEEGGRALGRARGGAGPPRWLAGWGPPGGGGWGSRWLLGEDGVRALADGAQPNTD